MGSEIRSIVIVGGGTAGWLSACMIAARADPKIHNPIKVTLIEAPDIPPIGVGEGTWPTMRRSLQRIGISEADFLRACDGSFKQGSRFDGWVNGDDGDHYFHPFTPPAVTDFQANNGSWGDSTSTSTKTFAETMSAQPRICALDLAPRQRAMPEFAGALNYAYHLDAGKLALLLASHATVKLGVRHLKDKVVGIETAQNGDIAAVRTNETGTIAGDLFIDCTGHAALLIGEHFGVPFIDRSHQLFNDRALAVQVPVAPESAITSQTNATAHSAGWIWDIGLPTRRGIGCVYSSAHLDDDAAAATLRAYLGKTVPDASVRDLSFRQLSFRSGHRARFWKRNCLAIGLAAGFLEPLEASAIVLIELSLNSLIDNFPTDRSVMDIRAKRFNELFRYRWDRIVDFLKLHYIPSRRSEPYWRDHRSASSIPARLSELMELWRHQPPSPADFVHAEEVFPAASHQYVLYGMGWPAPAPGLIRADDASDAARMIAQSQQRGSILAASLPTNRAYLTALRSASIDADRSLAEIS